MATQIKWWNNSYVIGWLLAFFLVVDLVIVGCKVDLSKSDWGTWVGSIGTVGTLIGTIWLAMGQARIKRQEERDRALIAAASFMVRLRDLIRGLTIAREKLATPLAQPDDIRETFADCLRVIGEGDLWPAEELESLLYLPKQTAVKLAWIGSRLRSTKAWLQKLCDDGVRPEAVPLVVRGLIYDLSSDLKHTGDVHNACIEFLLKHGFENAISRYEPEFDGAHGNG